ncbi:MAG: hypothetical protein HeimC2_08380 [Candidatus Heimdallarchaeota archaeon LC_2]|nr:MAG: hypothetical protein HeimC2_08380 [Candidatus Heimdallarchaeota archaeon LC_2]
MELNKSTTFLSIGIIGVVVAALYFGNDNSSSAFFALFVTVYTLASLRFFLEWKYYRRHRAILASLEFVLLPFAILVSGMYMSFQINTTVIVEGNLLLFTEESSRIFINLISLTLIPPLIVLQRLFFFYHSKRWDGFAMRRELYRSRKVPYLINSILAFSLFYLGLFQHRFDVIASLFVILWIIHTFKYYIMSQFGGIRNQTRQLDALLTNTDQYSRGSARSRTDSIQTEGSKRRSGTIPVNSRSGPRTVSAQHKNARQISSSSKKQTQKKGSRKSRSRSSIHVDPGNELKTLSHTAKINGDISKMLPTGRVDKSDLSCMFCYEEFKPSDKTIVLCPHCKFPGHANEYTSWIQVSSLCARCSQPIAKSEQTRPKYSISAKDYVNKVIKKL